MPSQLNTKNCLHGKHIKFCFRVILSVSYCFTIWCKVEVLCLPLAEATHLLMDFNVGTQESQSHPPHAHAEGAAPLVQQEPSVPVDQQWSPTPSSAGRRLKVFTRRITRSTKPPLLQPPEPAVEDTPKPLIPQRSRRLAAQDISHIPAPKRGEVLLQKRMGFRDGLQEPSPATKQKYEEIFRGDSQHSEALRQLFPPEGDVGARKRRRRPSARA